MKRQKITSSELLCAICFALCFFAFMLTEAFINERCAVILGSSAVNPVYTFGLVCTGLGFFSFSLLRRLCKKEKSRKTAQTILGILCIGAAMVLLFANQPALFLTSSSAALLLTGHISGCVYYNTAMYFAGSRYTGRLIGMGMGAAILLQFVVQNLMPQSVAFIISIVFSVAFVMCFIIKAPKDWILENPLPYSADTKKEFKKALLLIVAVVLMSLVAGMIDSVLTAFNAEKSYDIYGGVRLFYALGLILAGFLADIKERKYLPLSTVCTILLSSVCMFFLSDKVSYFAGTALMYLYSGFYVIFFHGDVSGFCTQKQQTGAVGGHGAHCAQLYGSGNRAAGIQHLWRSWQYGVGCSELPAVYPDPAGIAAVSEQCRRFSQTDRGAAFRKS